MSSYNQRNSNQRTNFPEIKLNYKNNPQLFNKDAESWAKAIGGGTKANQMRNFYDKILQYYQDIKTKDFKTEILPFVKMLNSKVAYAKGRKNICDTFENMMHQCIDQVNTEEDLKTFKLFFESVLGFHKLLENRR